MIDLDDPIFVISVAARMIGVQSQTLRYYESLGLIEPSRTGGNHRVYSHRDVEKVRRIRELIEELGINLAGVEIVVSLIDRLKQFQQKITKLESEVAHLQELSERHS